MCSFPNPSYNLCLNRQIKYRLIHENDKLEILNKDRNELFFFSK